MIIDRIADRMHRWSSRRVWTVIIAFALLVDLILAVLAIGAWQAVVRGVGY